ACRQMCVNSRKAPCEPGQTSKDDASWNRVPRRCWISIAHRALQIRLTIGGRWGPFMGEIGANVPSLPTYLLIAVTVLTGALIVFVMAQMRNAPASFVMGAAWVRYIMSAFHEVTYRPLAAGMSANALGSIGMVGLGLLTINWRHLAFKLLL